jgi:TRAP-type transport system periplasmic protein
MKKVLLVLVSILLVCVIVFAGCSGTPASTTPATTAPATSSETLSKVELKLVMFTNDVYPGNTWSHMFADKVKKISNGAMTIKIVGGPEAIPSNDAPSAAQRGTVDIANVMYTFANSIVPASDSLARSEYSPADLRKNNNPVLKYIQDNFNKAGLYYLGASSPSKAQYQTNFYMKKEITTLAQFKGLKIAATGGSNRGLIEGLSATCVPIGFSDYFTAMERGTVDGYNVGTPGIEDFGLTPVTGCMLDETFSNNGAGFIINLNTFNKLSASQQNVLKQAAIEVETEGSDTFDQIVAKVRTNIASKGVKITKLSPEEAVQFYTIYREGMWANDIKLYGDAAKQMKEWIVNPNFDRLTVKK